MTIEKLRKLVVEEGTDDGHVTVPNCKELLRHERNKVLDEAIAYLKSREKEEYDYFLNDSEDKHAYGKYCAFTEAAQELESLKL